MLVFVYGSLRRGQEFHGHLEGATFRGEHLTEDRWEMWELDGYPAVTRGGRRAIRGELFAIDAPILARLDELEETPTLYQRRELQTPMGVAWIYVVEQPPVKRRTIESGDWCMR